MLALNSGGGLSGSSAALMRREMARGNHFLSCFPYTLRAAVAVIAVLQSGATVDTGASIAVARRRIHQRCSARAHARIAMVLARLACILLIGALAQVDVRPLSLSWHETTDRAYKQWTFRYSLSQGWAVPE